MTALHVTTASQLITCNLGKQLILTVMQICFFLYDKACRMEEGESAEKLADIFMTVKKFTANTVESPNKGHFGTIILTFVRKVSLIGKSKMY